MKTYQNSIPREISWLQFNQRVLQEAADKTNPLVERIRFLGIYSNNLDEFYRVRVATLKKVAHLGKEMKSIFGEEPAKLLEQITELTVIYQKKFNSIYQTLITELEKNQIFLLNEKQLNKEQSQFVKEYYEEKVKPLLVPIMLRKGLKFPYLKDKRIYFAIKLIHKQNKTVTTTYSILQIPSDLLPRFIELPSVNDKKFLIMLDDVIRYNLHDIYRIFDFTTIEAYNIKVTRDAELEIDNDISKSYTQKIEQSLKKRKTGRITRFVYDSAIPQDLLDYLLGKARIDELTSLIPGGRYHNFRDYMKFPHLGNEKLIFPPMNPVLHKDLENKRSLIETIKTKDILLYFPYQRFSHIIDLIREAAIDPWVKSIYITVYRLAQDSQIAGALINAVRNGKQVTIVVELQARFDEENNMYWATKFQEEGAKVIFGVPGLKVHSKLLLITRNENDKLNKYTYVGTGNFNEKTAAIYTDYGLLTSDSRITSEVEKVFEFLQTNFKVSQFNHLLVSPFYMRKKLESLIENEIKIAKQGKKAYIWLKLNNLHDFSINQLLYKASMAGVQIKLIVRSVCSLVPGIKQQSENIQAISILGRFLEHARVFIFGNNGKELCYISSADLMVRNLDQRTEVACPIYSETIKKEIKKHFEMQWRDNTKARKIDNSISLNYVKNRSKVKFNAQLETYKYISQKFTKN
jgi:polyphosphate kinase